MEFKNIWFYNVEIHSSDNNGFIVKAGCTTRVYRNDKRGRADLLGDLEEYIENPEAVTKDYYENNKCRELRIAREEIVHDPPRTMDHA